MQLHQLLIGCKKKDPRSEIQFVDLFSERMLAYCRSKVKEPEDAEQLVNDGFLKFFQNINHFFYFSDEQTETLLWKIMDNLCKNHNTWEKKKRKLLIERGPVPLEQEQPAEIAGKMNYHDILGLVKNLPPRLREVFDLYYNKDMDAAEVAARLNITTGTVYSQWNRLKSLMADLINKNFYNNARGVAK